MRTHDCNPPREAKQQYVPILDCDDCDGCDEPHWVLVVISVCGGACCILLAVAMILQFLGVKF